MRVCVEYFSSLLSKQTGLGFSMKFKLALIAAASAAGGMVNHAASAAQSAASAAGHAVSGAASAATGAASAAVHSGAAAVSGAVSDAADRAKDAVSKP